MTINNDLYSDEEILKFEKKMLIKKIKDIQKNQLMRKEGRKTIENILYVIKKPSSIDELNDFLIKKTERLKEYVANDQTELLKLQSRLNEILHLDKVKKEEIEQTNFENYEHHQKVF